MVPKIAGSWPYLDMVRIDLVLLKNPAHMVPKVLIVTASAMRTAPEVPQVAVAKETAMASELATVAGPRITK